MNPSFESLQERLAALQETTAQARELIAQLEVYDPMYEDEYDGGAEFQASEIAEGALHLLDEQRDELDEIEEDIEDFKDVKAAGPGTSGGDDESVHEKARLIDGAKKMREFLRLTRRELRSAQQTYNARLRTSHLRYRDAYLTEVVRPLSAAASGTTSIQNSVSSLPPKNPPNGAASSDPTTTTVAAAASEEAPQAPKSPNHLSPLEARRSLLSTNHPLKPSRSRRGAANPRSRSRSPSSSRTSEALTSSLLRMHASMSTSLERSTFAQQMMDESSAHLRQLGDSYDSLDSLLEKSKGLLSVLLTSAKTDAWYLQTSVYVLLATLAWLVFRRWLYGPLWWFVWLPLRLVWGTGRAVVSSSSPSSSSASSKVVEGGDTVVAVDGRMDAADQVVGVDREVPVVQVGGDETGQQGKKQEKGSSDGADSDDSVVDQVGRIIDEAARQLSDSTGKIGGTEEGYNDDPAYRGGQGEQVAQPADGSGEQAVRDEL